MSTLSVISPLTALPPAPNRRMGDQQRFDEMAFASLKAQEKMVAELNADFIPAFNAALPAVNDAFVNRDAILGAAAQAQTAMQARAGAESARDKAEDWADKSTGMQVEAGRYSARHWSDVARAAAGETANQRVQRSWNIEQAVAEGGTLTFPPGMTYTPGADTLSLSFAGLDLYPGLQYEEMGEKGVPSSQVRLLFTVPAGSALHAYVIAGPAGEADTPTPGMAQKIEAVAWTLQAPVMAEGLVELPEPLRYRPGYSELRLSAMGTQLYVDQQFAEFGDGTATSNLFRIKYALKAGTELYAVIMSNFYAKE